jgi:hypothetical protein
MANYVKLPAASEGAVQLQGTLQSVFPGKWVKPTHKGYGLNICNDADGKDIECAITFTKPLSAALAAKEISLAQAIAFGRFFVGKNAKDEPRNYLAVPTELEKTSKPAVSLSDVAAKAAPVQKRAAAALSWDSE